MERAREVLPHGPARVVTVPSRLGGGLVIYVAAGGSTQLWRAKGWLDRLEPLAEVWGTVGDIVPGFDRLYARLTSGDIKAIDPLSGRQMSLGPLPRATRIGQLSFADAWRAVAVVDFRGALATFDAGLTWRPVPVGEQGVTQVSLRDGDFVLEAARQRILLGPRGELEKEELREPAPRGREASTGSSEGGAGSASSPDAIARRRAGEATGFGRRPLRAAIPGFPVRVGIYLQTTLEGPGTTPDTIVDSVHTLRQSIETDKLRISGAKLVLDGSIQEFTALLRWPGYYQGPNDVAGQLMTEEEIVTWLTPLQEAGIQIATHCNGDAAVDLLLNAIETVTARSAAPNARYRCEHCQLTTPAQYERMATLGVCANIFANHLWYWGDQHYEITVGPERAEGMEACATALAAGVPFSLHTDANVTPLGCLHSMWCAVNRVTPQGRVLGEAEKISAEEALRAVTLGSAYLLGLDEDMGSIQTGKWADFTVLAESPLDVDPMTIKDIAVWGTVLAGVKQPGAGAAALGA